MPSWWKKSSSSSTKKSNNEKQNLTSNFIDSLLQKKFKTKQNTTTTTRSEIKHFQNDTVSRSSSPSKTVARCQSFADKPRATSRAQPLPLPILNSSSSSSSLLFPIPKPACLRGGDVDGDVVTVSVCSDSSRDSVSDEHVDSSNPSFLVTDSDISRDQLCVVSQEEGKKQGNVLGNNTLPSALPKRRMLSNRVTNLQIPRHGAFFSAPDSSRSSPSRSPLSLFGTEQVLSSAYWAGRPCSEVTLVGSGHGSSPGSGQTSGHNSMGGDMLGQFFWQPSRGSPEYSPVPSSRMTSPGPGSRIQSGAVTPVHPRAGGTHTELQTGWVDDGRQQSHRLPLPPLAVTNSLPFSHSNSAATSPSLPRSPGRVDNPVSPGSRWKKGKLLGRGTFGHVYAGFNKENGEMCAMKEVTLFADDAKSKESAKQLMQEITLLSRLQHPNIVQYYGSETVDDKLYIYLEYVAGGSIYKLLQEYGQFGELAIRSYTQQILSGLAYLHAKNTVHRDIKGANILVDTNGRVKLADFGMAKHITGQSCALSLKGSPYWMAPEVIKHSNGCNLAVDIWSLGCTVLEMATTKPPWSQYEGVAAMFKIGNSKELPTIPDHLSSEGKDFVRKCLQRNPDLRPPASELLDHPFVKCAAPVERPILGPEASDPVSGIAQGEKALGIGQRRNLSLHPSRVLTNNPHASEIRRPRNLSCPVSPIRSPHLSPRPPQHRNGRTSPSPISSPRTASGASTPLNGNNHLVYFQEGHGGLPKSSNTGFITGPAHHDSNHVMGNQFVRPPKDESFDVQSILADRVCRQLLGDNVKIKPSLNLSPNSPLLSRANGL